jgi:hypothetical protein
MFIDKMSNRERYLAIVTLSLISIAVAYALLIAPLSGIWKNLNNQMRSKVDILEKDSNILADQKALTSEYTKLSKYAATPKSEEEAVGDTLTYIENVSRTDSCFIANIKPVGVTKEGAYKKILIDVAVEASMDKLSKFLYDIENPRDTLMNIERFTISSKSGQVSTLKCTLIISKILLN